MRNLAFCAIFLATGLVAQCAAQCTPGFIPGDQVPGVTSGSGPATINAALEWDFDGAGPQPAKLVVAGAFAEAGGSPATNLALWDGALWTPFGAGANGTVARLAAHNGEIVAAGAFTSIGGVSAPGGLAAYDGSAWRALPTPGGTPTQILSFAGLLYASGAFNFGGTPGNYVVSFDGTTWSAVGAPFDGPINDIAPYQGQLMAGGAFTTSGVDAAFCLAKWDGVHWSTFNGGTNDAVRCLKQFGSDLYVGGVFTAAGAPAVSAAKVAKWNGAVWSSNVAASVFSEVKSLGGTATTLVAGGVRPTGPHLMKYFTLAGAGVPSGTTELGATFDTDILWIGSYQNRLHIAGTYQVTAPFSGDIRHFSISRVIDGKWHALTGGLNGRITALETHNGQLFAAGDFTRWKETPVKKVVTWNGTDWVQFNNTFPAGMDADGQALLKSWHGRLYLTIPSAAPITVYWNGSAWVADEIPIGNALSMVEFVGDRLMCGINVGWRQTSAFTPYAYASVFPRTVWSSIPYNGGYVIGGEFTTANGAPALRVVFSDGNTWSQMGQGFSNSRVAKLVNLNGQIVALGGMANSGATPVGGAARWDGAAWQPLGTGFFTAPIYEINDGVAVNNKLYVVGNFASENPINGLVRFNGTVWEPLGSLISNSIFAINGGTNVASVGDEVWMTGQFTHAGGIPSYQLARYRIGSAVPHVDQAPAPVAVHRGEQAAFSVSSSGDAPFTYQWRHDGVPIGAPSLPTLAIGSVTDADRGIYDCVIGNVCNTTATSAGARLTVLTADLGQQGGQAGSDNHWDNNDFVVFIDLFFSHDPAADIGRQGGVPGGDGAWDNNDFVLFIDLFFGAF
jgi:hypothetical protein